MDKVVMAQEGGGCVGSREALQLQISELVHNLETKTTEIAQLRMELKKFKDTQVASSTKLLPGEEEHGNHRVENNLTALDLLSNPTTFCDDQKQLLLEAQNNASSPSVVDLSQQVSSQAHHPLEIVNDGCGSETDLADVLDTLLPTSTSDWDKQSSSSISEMSVACLQDRILQMEETHYSTNEELQATLQELTDLQDQLTELQGENEHLAEEKAVLLESLCSQTEKLEDCRAENENLRQLLVQDASQQTLSSSDREIKLLEVLKNSSEEKESLQTQMVDFRSASDSAKEEAIRYHDEVIRLQEQISSLQSNIETSNNSKRLLEKQLTESRELLDNIQIEISRTRTQLENERIKVSELQQAREIVDKSELDELLDNARREKDHLESHAAMLSEQVAFSQCDAARHKEMINVLQDEMMVAKNNAKKEINDLEYNIDQLNSDKEQLVIEIGAHRESIHELERKCQRHLEDKRELRATICDLKHKVQEASDKVLSLEKNMEETVKIHQLEMQEWKQFQEDLLMTVRVANDFKAEAQEELEGLLLENKHLRERIITLHSELEKTKQVPQRINRPASCTESHMLNTVEQEISLQQNRAGGRRDSRPLSVKSLIESIECAAKQVKAQNAGNGNVLEKDSVGTEKVIPDESLNSQEVSTTTEPLKGKQELSKVCQEKGNDKYYSKVPSTKSSPEPKLSRLITDIPSSGGVPDSDGTKSSSPISILANKLDPLRRSSYSDILDRKDPLASLGKGGGSKRNALLKWCQNKTIGYKGIDITNFSSSWNDGLAFCALLHTYLSEKIPYDDLDCKDKRRNFSVAFKAAESVGIQCNLNINDMITTERPDWQAIMTYVTAIYKHFET